MKKLYFLVFASGVFSTANTQTFYYLDGQTADNELIGNDYVMADIYFVTADSSSITFAWESISNTLPVGWDYSMCDYETCYPGVPATGLMSPISDVEFDSGVKGFLKVTASALSIPGEGTVEIYVYDQANYANGDTVIFNFNMPGAGFDDAELNAVSVYPNPVADFVYVENAGTSNISYELFNLSGKKIVSGLMAENSTEKLDLSDAETGLYFLSLVSDEGLRSTRKIIVR